MISRLALLLAVIAAALGLAWGLGRPPAALPTSAAPEQFSAERAFPDIQLVARAPHPTGSTEDAAVRGYLLQRLQAMGLEASEQAVPLSPRGRRVLQRWRVPVADGVPAVNVVGVLPGLEPTAPAVVLMAHHDTVPGSPGAADDTAGVAAILEIVRALKILPDRRRDVIVAFTDAEEISSDGAAGFFAAQPQGRIGAVINLETRGGAGRALMFETGPNNAGLMALYASKVEHPSALSAAVMAYRLMSNSTDFTIGVKRGLAGVNLAYFDRADLYHSPQATPAAIDLASVQHLGGQAADLARALVEADALPPRTADAVFADLWGRWLIAYSASDGVWILVAAALLLGFAAYRIRRAGLSLQGLAVGVGRMALATVSAGVLLWAFNFISGAGPKAGYYDRLAALPRLEVQAVLVSLAALIGFCSRPSTQSGSRWLGAVLLVGVLAVAAQAVAPMAAPVFAWPLLAVALAAAIASGLDPEVGSPPAIGVVAVLGVAAAAQTLGLAHLTFLTLGADMPQIMAVFGLLATAPLIPLFTGTLKLGGRRIVAGVLLLLALGIALWVRLDPPAPSVPAYARANIG
jgi:hypothetical protein